MSDYLLGFASDIFFLALIFWILNILIVLFAISFGILSHSTNKSPLVEITLTLLILSHLIIDSIYTYKFSIAPLLLGYVLWFGTTTIIFAI